MIRQGLNFVAVGAAAFITHLSVAAVCVELAGLHPLAANAIAFVVAFMVSFTGHARFTFGIERRHWRSARTRFFCVACLGFVVNQIAYAKSLAAFGGAYYLPILAAILVSVAVLTFTLSKLWAFSTAIAHQPAE